jgi:hypothetical protein
MAVSSGHITAGTVAIQIDGSSVSNYTLHIHNQDNQENLYLGGADVTTSNGLVLPKLDSTELKLSPNDSVWIVSNSESHLVSYLKIT